MKCRKCGAEVEAPRTVCPNCGTSVPKQDYSVVREDAYPMAWYKFQIYFGQWLGMGLSILYAVLSLSMWNLLLCAFYIASAFLHLATRQALADYRSAGPKLLYAQYIINEVVKIFTTGFSVVSVATTAIIVTLNYIYFKKREALFD